LIIQKAALIRDDDSRCLLIFFSCFYNLSLYDFILMYTLGINAVFHDSAACLIKDGKLLAAAEEERFTHIKHGKRPIPFSVYELPFHAIAFCLEKASIHINDVDFFAYSFNPDILRDRGGSTIFSLPLDYQPGMKESPAWDNLLLSYVVNAPEQLRDGWPHHLQKYFRGGADIRSKWHFVDHHLSHAASAFLPSPFAEAAVMTIDGRGEKATTSYYNGKGTDLQLLGHVEMPHSLGLLYERITTHLGFLHSSDEYKVMALASFGEPKFIDQFRSMIHIHEDGQYTIDDIDLSSLFGPQRLRDEPFTEHHFAIAHSLQLVLQETVLTLANWLQRKTKQKHLCLAGGVALNCVMNAYLKEHGAFESIWVQPAAGDAGTALGAALVIDSSMAQRQDRVFLMDHVYWGPDYSDQSIEQFLRWAQIPHRRLDDVALETAALLQQDKIIGWFQGPMEFGPRSLGSRSILASPLNASMQARLNVVKDREDFRPVAPVVIEEDAHEWFHNSSTSPFMLFVYSVKEERRSTIPAVTHTDGTARIQTINEQQHPRYYQLLKAFKQLTGVPVLVNTSFNTLGKPIVSSPRDAIECFWSSPFDALVIGSYLIEKQPQSHA
jgi:carbamoyltransferase